MRKIKQSFEFENEDELKWVQKMLDVVNVLQKKEGKPNISMKRFLYSIVMQGVMSIQTNLERQNEQK